MVLFTSYMEVDGKFLIVLSFSGCSTYHNEKSMNYQTNNCLCSEICIIVHSINNPLVIRYEH